MAIPLVMAVMVVIGIYYLFLVSQTRNLTAQYGKLYQQVVTRSVASAVAELFVYKVSRFPAAAVAVFKKYREDDALLREAADLLLKDLDHRRHGADPGPLALPAFLKFLNLRHGESGKLVFSYGVEPAKVKYLFRQASALASTTSYAADEMIEFVVHAFAGDESDARRIPTLTTYKVRLTRETGNAR